MKIDEIREMENRKRKSYKIFPAIVWTCRIILFVSLLCHYPSEAHFIQFENNEFRANGLPRPGGIPPHLPIIDQHFPPPHPPPSPPQTAMKELTPVEFVVDLTNDLTYRILHYHSILNRNNFAFSPTALMSILVALYEGSTGRSALELKNVLRFPNNKDVLRVGYRDIHRRLRTYFFGSENPLKGLSLNKDNVTIIRDYENILMFYGYDLGMDMVSSVASSPSTPTISSTVEMSSTATMSPGVLVATTRRTIEPTTTPPTNTTEEETTMPISTTTSSETTTTESPTTTIEAMTTTTTETPTTTTTEATQTTDATTPAEAATESTTDSPTSTESTAEGEPRSGDEAAELISTVTGEPFLRIQKARVTRLPSERLQAPPHPQSTARKQVATRSQSMRLTEKKPTAPKLRNDYLPATSRTFQSERISIRQTRPKRHLFGSFKEADANLFVTLFHPQQLQHNLFGLTGPASGPALNHVHDFEVEIEPQFITGPSSGSGPSEHKQNFNTDIISHIFYLGSQEVIHTTYKVYNAVLYFKYFDHLKMSVLELELDTPEYNLMILLPDYHTDMVTAAASLHLGPTLRLLRKQLKPTWVQAIIPDFKLDGAMFLTNDLQNLGICDIFEPNRADFRPMTEEKGIYVKHIEQSINVNIRTHPINQLRRNYGAAQLHPIQISVNHPFLFFIIDRDLDVAVMAGRILNPLNVRIQ